LIGPVRWPARRDPRPLVLANYYPWYDPSTLTQNFGDQPTGPANTNDPATVAQALDLARGSGIDGFIVEYEATAANDPRIDYVFNAADQRPGFQVALTIDLDLLVRRNNGNLTTQILDDALGAVASHAGHPSQLQVNGQPVVFVYGTHWVTGSQWGAALQRLYTATGVRPYAIPDDASLGTPAQYLYGTNNLSSMDQLLQWAAGNLLQTQLQPGLDGQSGPLWVAPVSPGYDDTRLGRAQPIKVDRNGGVRYNQEWYATLNTLPDWVIITSWNEYYEQTHIAPGSLSGTQALDQTAAWAASFHQTG
ncbi:MAG: hypothetical protein QOE63_828, partial [Acidimicrobiaceae bacterium]